MKQSRIASHRRGRYTTPGTALSAICQAAEVIARGAESGFQPGLGSLLHGSTPIPFILGTGRCGTTFLRVMLDAHPQLAIPPETHFFPELARAAKDPIDPRGRIFEALTRSRNWTKFQIDPEVLRNRLATIEPFSSGEAIRTFYRLYAEQFNKPRWGDKTPAYLAHMGLIQDLLPEARFIHLIRDGRDVALSVLHLMDRDGKRHTAEDGATWWVQRITRGRRESSGIAHYLEVRYEDLVQEPEPTLHRVCQFVDLNWDPMMLRYHEKTTERMAQDGQKPRELRQLSRPPDIDRVGRWRDELSAAELARVEEIAGPLLRELGYA